VSRVDYSVHRKEGKPDSLRVDYWSGMMVVGSEWVCFNHEGYARQKAEQWWRTRIIGGEHWGYPETSLEAETTIKSEITATMQTRDSSYLKEPTRIATRKAGKYTEIVSYDFNRTESHERGINKEFA
jgi:DNA repair protein RadD